MRRARRVGRVEHGGDARRGQKARAIAAGAQPPAGIFHAEFAAAHEPRERLGAGIGQSLVPHAARNARQFARAGGCRECRAQAGNLAVVGVETLGELRKARPIAGLAQLPQPVHTQAVADGGARGRFQKAIDLLGGSRVQSQPQRPVFDVALEQVSAHLGESGIDPLRVAEAKTLGRILYRCIVGHDQIHREQGSKADANTTSK